MDLKLPKMLCKDSRQHHVMFHELNSVSSLLCIAQNVHFEFPYKVLYFETPFLMIFKYYAWASYVRNMNAVLMYVLMSLVCRYQALGGGFRNLNFDLLYKYIHILTRLANSRTSSHRPAWDFAKINTINLVPLAKESRFPKEQSL